MRDNSQIWIQIGILGCFLLLSSLSMGQIPPSFNEIDTNPADAFPPPPPTGMITFTWDAVICDHYEFYMARFYPFHLQLVGTTKCHCFTLMESNYESGIPAVRAVGTNGFYSQLTFWHK